MQAPTSVAEAVLWPEGFHAVDLFSVGRGSLVPGDDGVGGGGQRHVVAHPNVEACTLADGLAPQVGTVLVRAERYEARVLPKKTLDPRRDNDPAVRSGDVVLGELHVQVHQDLVGVVIGCSSTHRGRSGQYVAYGYTRRKHHS